MNPTRYREMKDMLEARRGVIESDVHGKMRAGRRQEDIGFALLQINAETLRKIATALEQLETGAYGTCAECGEEIAEKRLRALPFAVRCKDCQETCDARDERRRHLARDSAAPFARVPTSGAS